MKNLPQYTALYNLKLYACTELMAAVAAPHNTTAPSKSTPIVAGEIQLWEKNTPRLFMRVNYL